MHLSVIIISYIRFTHEHIKQESVCNSAYDVSDTVKHFYKSKSPKESHFVGNKAKGRTSKRAFQENKARQIFRKTNIFYRFTYVPYIRVRIRR